MAEAKAVAKYVRVGPYKARQVVDLIKGKRAAEALTLLRFMPQRAARAVEKVLKSAIANASHVHSMKPEDLYIDKIFVDQGPSLKRSIPRARGRATPILKPMSHITIVVNDKR